MTLLGKRRLPGAWILVAGSLLGAALGTAAGISRAEDHDPFCTVCHTAPEVEYFDRAQAALAGEEPLPDLSSFHYAYLPAEFGCIECHRGDGRLIDRARTLAIAARDTLVYLAGQADPTLEKDSAISLSLLDAACTKCHAEALLVVGFENHFHNRLPEAERQWRSGEALLPPSGSPDLDPNTVGLKAAPTGVGCVDCHTAHRHLPGSEMEQYVDLEGEVYSACARCHTESGHGPQDLGRTSPPVKLRATR